ncbi:MAG: hypothetical protein ABFD18_06185 [Syntrophomonas sp.]
MGQVSVAQARDLWANKPGTATMQNAAQAVGNGTDLSVAGYGSACLQISGVFVGIVTFLGSADGLNFVPITAVPRGSGPSVFSASVDGLYDVDCRGLQAIRARVNEYTSGSITVVGVAEAFAGYNPSLELKGSLPAQTAITRAVYSTTQTYNCDIPKGAKYAVVSNWIQGVTGTFTTGQGLTISIGTTIGGYFVQLPLSMAFLVTTNPNQRLLGVWGHDYTAMGDVAKNAQVNTLKSTPLPLLGEKLYISATITGTFEAGQGFDLSSQVIFYN